MGWRSLKKSALSLSLGHGIRGRGFSVLCSPYARFPGVGQNLGLSLKFPVKAWEFCPLLCSEVSSSHGSRALESHGAFQWSLMLCLTPAEEKTLNRELLLTFGFASEALFSRQRLMGE